MQNFNQLSHEPTICRSLLRNRASIADANARDKTPLSRRHQRTFMTEREERLARERQEISARVARFRITQEKFQRERQEFFDRTWQHIRGLPSPRFWR